MADQRLLFVYNVDASPVALLKDLYSGLRTGTTDCHLCDLTFGRLLKDRSWAAFVEGLPVEVDFLMRSTFRRRYPAHDRDPCPAAYLETDGQLEQVLSADQLNAVADLDELRALVSATLDAAIHAP